MKTKKSEFEAFRLLAVSQSNYGKSYAISEFVINLINKKHINPKRILIFSKTYKTDPSQRKLISLCKEKYKPFEDGNCYEQIDSLILMELFETQKLIKETAPQKLNNYLVMFDDQLSDSIFQQKRENALVDFLAVGRHFNISVSFAMQHWKVLPPVMRNQITIMLIGKLASSSSVMDMLCEFDQCDKTSKKECRDYMYQIWSESVQKHGNRGFLVVHTTKQFGTGRLQAGFDGEFFDI